MGCSINVDKKLFSSGRSFHHSMDYHIQAQFMVNHQCQYSQDIFDIDGADVGSCWYRIYIKRQAGKGPVVVSNNIR